MGPQRLAPAAITPKRIDAMIFVMAINLFGVRLWCKSGAAGISTSASPQRVSREISTACSRGGTLTGKVTVLCACWYLRYKLSLRDLVEMMAERGLSLAHTKVM
ncbi:hypothetical protein CS8_015810 [Cupriavidus sp. 8B]